MRREWLARAGLAVLGLVIAVGFLVLLEGVLRVLCIASGPPRHDPFAGFSNSVPMFEPAVRPDGTKIFRTAAARRVPAPQEFLAEKPAGGFRIFVVGESSAAGVPYSAQHAFSGFLGRRLAADVPGVPVEVVNAAFTGYASRRILAVVRDIAQYQPDLLIVYAGHNEYGERRFYSHLVDMDPRLFRLWEGLAQTRLFRVVADLPLVGFDARRTTPSFHFDDVGNAFEMFAVAGEHLDGVYPSERELQWGAAHYRYNVRAMIDVMRSVDARTLLLSLGQDYADWPPGASSHRAGLEAPQLEQWQHEFSAGERLASAGDCVGALAAYERARLLDDQFAALHFAIGRCARATRDVTTARMAFRRASDLDRVPHGAPTAYVEILRELAVEQGAMFIDIDARLERGSPDGLVGANFFSDFVHPNLEANQLIAGAIEDMLRGEGLPVPAPRWIDRYRDPSPAALRTNDPTLVIQEHLIRGAACALARRYECAIAEADLVLAIDPNHTSARQFREGVSSHLPKTADLHPSN